MKHHSDVFTCAIGPSPDGLSEEITLRRVKQKEPMVVADTFLLSKHEAFILLEFLLDQVEFQDRASLNLSAKGLVRPNHNF